MVALPTCMVLIFINNATLFFVLVAVVVVVVVFIFVVYPDPTIFRCVLASLYEGLSVRRSVGPSVRRSVGPSVGNAFARRAETSRRTTYFVYTNLFS